MKKILITGSKGQLGEEILSVLQKQNEYKIIATDREELDITSNIEVLNFIDTNKPDIIINCAAYTAVDDCETNIETAYLINAIGPRNLAIAAKKNNSTMIHVSTDYVFDGEKNDAYKEFDSTNPQSVYGKSKLAGEEYVKSFADKYFIIRTAWLYGKGKNFVKTMLRLAETNKQIRVVSDQYGTPTSTEELSRMILYLMNSQKYGTYHGTCEGKCSWADFAEKIFSLTNKEVEVIRINSSEYSSNTKRPQNSVLENYVLKIDSDYSFEYWEVALKRYLLNNN